MSDTPRTDQQLKLLHISCDDSCCAVYIEKNGLLINVVDADFARTLERERDRLSDALRSIAALYESKEMTATVDQRIGDAYDMRCMARSALAAVKGGQPCVGPPQIKH